MTAHPHAALMMEYARDAAVCAEPWLLWEWSKGGDRWLSCDHNPEFIAGNQYRRKPLPLECFVIVSRDGRMGCAWETRADAEESAGDCPGLRIVHFREVPNE